MHPSPDGARPRRLPHAQIHLPPLSAGYALTLVDVLERAIEALWRAHGQAMAELRTLRRATRPPPGAVADGKPDAPDDVDF
jgi:hypothetical protein